MPSAQTKLWVQRLVWICIYAGLLTLSLSLFLAKADQALARGLQCGGGALVVIGVALIYLRSRWKDDSTS